MTEIYPVGSFVRRTSDSELNAHDYGYAGQVAEVISDNGSSLRIKFLCPRNTYQGRNFDRGIGVTREYWKPI